MTSKDTADNPASANKFSLESPVKNKKKNIFLSSLGIQIPISRLVLHTKQTSIVGTSTAPNNNSDVPLVGGER